MTKPNLKDIADKIRTKGLESSSRHIEDTIYDMLIDKLDDQLESWTDEVIEILQDMEHPEPRTKAEYDERNGEF